MNILKYLRDTAVLWGLSGRNAYGELTFTAAVEIPVRWEDRNESFTSKDGKVLTSRAVIHVNQDIIPDGFMYLGGLTDLSTEQKANPKLVNSAYSVKAFIKIKSLKGNYTLRKVYLFGGDVRRSPVS